MTVPVFASRAAKVSPGGARDPTYLPDAARTKRKTQRDLQEEQGGVGVYSLPLQTHWSLKKPEWVDDIIPEIMDGKNILDFVDPEIEVRLGELEEEEDERAELAAMQVGTEMADNTDRAEAHAAVSKLAKTIRKTKVASASRPGTLAPSRRRDLAPSRLPFRPRGPSKRRRECRARITTPQCHTNSPHEARSASSWHTWTQWACTPTRVR